MARDDPDAPVRSAAIGKIGDLRVVEDIAMNKDSAEASTAAALIEDSQVLARIARSAHHWMARFTAVTKLKDEDVLKEIVRTEQEGTVRRAAQKLLGDV